MRRGRDAIPFADINAAARRELSNLAPKLLPKGHMDGRDWVVGSLKGEPGSSLRIVLAGTKAGVWKDFATGECGGDPISLFAAVTGIAQAEAARRLAKMLAMEAPRG